MDHLESKIAEQSEEIIKLKATIDTQLECNLSHLMNVKESSTAGDCTTVRKPIVPASCRELAIMGHSNHGLYLVQNRDTKKIETIFCDFRTLGKFYDNNIKDFIESSDKNGRIGPLLNYFSL